MTKRILVIDDDTDICLLLRRFLTKNGYEVALAHTGEEGLATLDTFNPDLVMTDFKLGDIDGVTILSRIKAKLPHVVVIIITGYSDIKVAINVMKQGAYDYITKPLFPDEILITLQKALAEADEEKVVSESKPNHVAKATPSTTKRSTSTPYLFGEGPESQYLYRQVDLVAPTNYSVIIYGESGSGKEAVAQEIHKRSKRATGPFVAMDCGAISRELSASELFGHEKGSFTGALDKKIGHFEMANGGTLFLDEVGNLPYDVQVSLLRVVQERKVRRIGGSKEIEIDVRIIVASNERLLEAARKNNFREDLYYRFNEFSIDVPPLRSRKSDIMVFAQFFLEKTNAELSKNVKGFTPDATTAFMEYPWPGNLREMRNVIKRATLMTDTEYIDARILPFELLNYNRLLKFDNTNEVVNNYVPEPTTHYVQPIPQAVHINPPVVISQPVTSDTVNLKVASSEAEYEVIINALRKVNFNKSKAAELLGIDRKTLYNKMRNSNIG
jgi:two-component system, NtrC family, response regulator HydG